MPVNVMQQGVSGRRKQRYPKHPFQVSHLPYHICPFFIAPVLPGETMKNLLFQSRVVTDPIKNPLVGWWIEYYFFYVKLSDLYEREELREMVLNPAWSPSDVTTAQGYTTALPDTYHPGGTGMIDYTQLCYRRVVDEFFRDEDETYQDHRFIDLASTGRTYSLAQIIGNSAFDSVSLLDDETAQDVNLIDAATSDVLTVSEVEAGFRLWQQQRMFNITELSYEDWLSQFGVRAEQEEAHKPELIRYVREWSYPTNTIDPTNGTARSAVSWTVQERADKNRSFREPGFLYGVTVCRPKVYIRAQEGSFTSLLNDYRAWMPPMAQGNAEWSRKTVATNAGPLQTIVSDADGYVVDLRDLFIYGEQFTNMDRTDTNKNFMDNVTAALTDVRYPQALADIDELFVTSGANNCRQHGVVDLTIACAPVNPMLDLSPRGGERSGQTSGGNF